MRWSQRLGLALTIVVVDLVTIGVPLTAFLAAGVLLARPAWFPGFVVRLYTDGPRQDAS